MNNREEPQSHPGSVLFLLTLRFPVVSISSNALYWSSPPSLWDRDNALGDADPQATVWARASSLFLMNRMKLW